MTGASFTNIQPNRIMGYQDWRERFLQYLDTSIKDRFSREYSGDGVFLTPLGLAADGADKFKITGASYATDGIGNVVQPSASVFSEGVQFENALGVPYDVGVSRADKPSGIQVNPVSGMPDYVSFVEEIGLSGTPDAVVDNGNGTITLTVTGVTEAGVTHAGRYVMVYLARPAKNAITPAIAIETLTVAYTGGLNKITTSGSLGQAVISTTPSDYVVICLGPMVRRNTPLSSASGVCFIGEVVGAGAGNPPASFDTSGQTPLSADLYNLNQIARKDAHGFLKVYVVADASDVDEPQIRVVDTGLNNVFTVDEDGDLIAQTGRFINTLRVDGNIDFNGPANAIGNLATDTTTFLGWVYAKLGGANKFVVDGQTGRIGIGGDPDGTAAVKLTGNTVAAGNLSPTASATYDLGGSSARWRDLYVNTLHVSGFDITGDLDPATDNAYDIGDITAVKRWRHLNMTGIQTIRGQTLGGNVFAKWLQPSSGNNVNWRWEGTGVQLWLTMLNDAESSPTAALIFNRSGVALSSLDVNGNLRPAIDDSYDLGSSGRRWFDGYFAGTLYADNGYWGGGVYPAWDYLYDIGSTAYRWTNIYSKNLLLAANTPSYPIAGSWDNMLSIDSNRPVLRLRDGDSPVNVKEWRWELSSPVGTEGQLNLNLYTDAQALVETMVKFNRTAAGSQYVAWNCRLSPTSTGSNFDLGETAARWNILYAQRCDLQRAGGAVQTWHNTNATVNNRRWKWEFIGSTGLDLTLLTDGDAIITSILAMVRGTPNTATWDARLQVHDILPTADVTWSLSTDAARWSLAHIQHIYSRANNGRLLTWVNDSGSANYKRLSWRYAASSDLRLSRYNDADSLVGDILAVWFGVGTPYAQLTADLFPGANDTWSFGSASLRWMYAYVRRVFVGDTASDGDYILPNRNSTSFTVGHDLGSSTFRWRNLYAWGASINGPINWWGGALRTDIKSGTQSITSTVLYTDTVTFETSVYDNGKVTKGGGNTTFTVSTTGFYKLALQLNCEPSTILASNAWRSLNVAFRINGSALSQYPMRSITARAAATIEPHSTLYGAVILKLTAGDVITVGAAISGTDVGSATYITNAYLTIQAIPNSDTNPW